MIFSKNRLAVVLPLTAIATMLLSSVPALNAEPVDSASFAVHEITTLNDAKKALAKDPNCADAIACIGCSKYGSGDYKGTIADLTKALDLNPKDSYWKRSAYSYLTYSYIALHDYANALVNCKKNLAWEPRANVYSDAAKLCGILNKPDEQKHFLALAADFSKSGGSGLPMSTMNVDPEEYAKQSKGAPNSSDALIGSGARKYEANDYKGAIADLSKALSLKPKDAIKTTGAYSYLYRSYVAIQDYQGALDCCKKRLEWYPRADVATHAALACKRLGKLDEEKKYEAMAKSLQKYENRVKEAMKSLALASNPNTVDQCLVQVSAQLKKDPENAIVHLVKLRCHGNKIKWRSELHYTLPASKTNRGGTQMDAKTTEALKDADDPLKVEKTLSTVQARLKTNPNDAEAGIIKAECIYTKEQRDGAITELTWLIDHPVNGKSEMPMLAKMSQQMGCPELAKKALSQSTADKGH